MLSFFLHSPSASTILELSVWFNLLRSRFIPQHLSGERWHQHSITDSDVHQATEALEELSIANPAVQATKISAPRPNFPPPRELQDLIYGLLLYHNNVHEEPYYKRTESKRGKVRQT
jgi:hypothetical protein